MRWWVLFASCWAPCNGVINQQVWVRLLIHGENCTSFEAVYTHGAPENILRDGRNVLATKAEGV